MHTILLFTGIIFVLFLMAKYALSESERIERNRKFLKNLKDFDSKKSKK